jgi:hypothetical protein
MSELKTRPTTASVSDFLALQPDQRRADCEAVLAMMEAATGERAEWGRPSSFGRYAYGNNRKAHGVAVVGFSPRKNDLTLYLMPGFEGRAELMAKLGKHKTGKSCLYLKKLADVDAGVLEELIECSVQAMDAQRIRR